MDDPHPQFNSKGKFTNPEKTGIDEQVKRDLADLKKDRIPSSFEDDPFEHQKIPESEAESKIVTWTKRAFIIGSTYLHL